MKLSEQIAVLEQEIERLKAQPASPALTRLLDLLEPEITWQEEHWQNIPKDKRPRLEPLIQAFRELRPKEGKK